MPAWRTMIDQHACPAASVSGADGVGSVMMGSPTVLINMQMACRVGDIVVEKPGLAMGPANPIIMGCPTVMIGEVGMGSPGGGGLAGALAGGLAGALLGAAIAGPMGAVAGAVLGAAAGNRIGPNSPLYGQETPMSCGIASVRMVIASVTNKNVPESDLRAQSQQYPGGYNLTNGTSMGNMTEVLRAQGVANATTPQSGQTVSDIARHTASGDPAIIHFANPGGGGHFVVVDSVRTDANGDKTLVIRDPWPPGQGTRTEMSETDFMARGFSGFTIYTN
jgi:hypothetical protein